MHEQKRARTIAVVGIDGSGKSSILHGLLEMLDQTGQRVTVLHSPLYHETPNTPLQRLSRALEAFSTAADQLKSFELKAAALFLQMTLFGPVERFMTTTFRPQVLVTERNAIVDSLAYGPFYNKLMSQRTEPATLERALREKIDGAVPQGYEEILRWIELQNERLSRSLDIWGLGRHVGGFFDLQPAEAASALAEEYQSALPDVVIMLDVTGETAALRCGRRAGATAELHEEANALEQLRQSYLGVMPELERISPGLRTHVIRTDAGDDVDASLEHVLALAGIAGGRQQA